MSDYLLDTNHVSPLVTLNHPLRAKILERAQKGDTFAVCVPVITESLFGLGILPRGIQNRAEWNRLRALLRVYIPDERNAEAAADLQIAMRRDGRQLVTVDATIAAVALRFGLILLTTDQDFQPIPDLIQENWL